MKQLKLLSSLLIIFSINKSIAQDTTSISLKDLQPMLGCWEGTISYLDYGSGKSFSMPARLQVKKMATSNSLLLSNEYPNEPSANGADTLVIAADGKKINDEIVVSVRRYSKTSILLMTDQMGVDGNDDKPALLRHIYTITSTGFTRCKEVQFVGSSAWVKRNEFTYKRIPCRK